MPSAIAKINPDILSWARERAQLSVSVLAKRTGLPNEKKIIAWEEGSSYPTFKQAQSFAKATHIPFGYLFLPQPPEIIMPLPDLRTVGSEPLEHVSSELLEVIRQVMFRQAWYQDYVKVNYDGTNSITGRLTIKNSIKDIVADMREMLGVSDMPSKGTWEEYSRHLIQCIEDLGVLVMRSGIVGNNTRRPLSVSEFRGFAISDRIAPVIFINAADAPEARLFTLIHELAHIWLGISGISDAKPNTHRQEEKVCNAVAAEFLVPTSTFLSKWNNKLPNWRDNLAYIAAQFHVSQWVIARKALDNKLISSADYDQYTKEIIEKYKNIESGGGSFYRGLTGKVSKRFSLAVLIETLSGRTLYRDAGRLLGIKPSMISHYAKELGF